MTVYTNYAYTDQLLDTTINLNTYITRYSDTNFQLTLNNSQPIIATVKNIFEQSHLIDDFKEKGSTYFLYYVEDGDLPDDVARLYYQSEDFWWAVLLFNDIDNLLTGWPLSNSQLITLRDIYVEKENKYSSDGYYELLFDWNEERRKIDVLKPEHLYELIRQFKSILVNETGTTLKL